MASAVTLDLLFQSAIDKTSSSPALPLEQGVLSWHFDHVWAFSGNVLVFAICL